MTSRFNPDDTIRDYELRHGIEARCNKCQTCTDEKEFSKKTKGSFDTYVEKLNSQSFAKDFVFDIALPGHSSNGKESCGQTKLVGCLDHDLHKLDCGYCKKVVMSCNSKGCRVCYVSAIKREASAITDRLVTFANLKNNRRIYLKVNRSRVLQHIVVSPPDEVFYKMENPKSRKELKNKQRKILKILDIDGGVSITHPYRFYPNLEGAYLSPHFHNIVTGWLDSDLVKQISKGEGKYSEFKGWNILGVRTLDSEKDCYGLAKYILSHSAVYEKEIGKRSSEHSVSYFGECQNRKFKVDRVLKNSVTGYEQLDNIMFEKSEITLKKVVYPLQAIDYTFSTITDSIKKSSNEFHTITDIHAALRMLRGYITPQLDISLDNPAKTQSEPEERPLIFLQMRFDYGNSQYSIVQSEYVTVILDPDLEQLCPEDSSKMQTLTPATDWHEFEKDNFTKFFEKLEDGVITQFDNSQINLEYLSSKHMILGMPYFNDKGELLHETGIYSKPDCLDDLNPTLYHRISKNIGEQEFKYKFKIENGRIPTRTELQESLHPKIISFRETSKNSNNISDYF